MKSTAYLLHIVKKTLGQNFNHCALQRWSFTNKERACWRALKMLGHCRHDLSGLCPPGRPGLGGFAFAGAQPAGLTPAYNIAGPQNQYVSQTLVSQQSKLPATPYNASLRSHDGAPYAYR